MGVIDVLERLQELDERIQGFETLKADFPRRLQQLKIVLESEAVDLKRAREQLKVLHDSYLGVERGKEETHEQLRHAEEKLAQITNNLEYQAGLKEVANLKKRVQDLETDVVTFKERHDAAAGKAAALEQSYQAHQQEYDSQHSDVDTRMADLQAQLEKHLGQKKSMISDVPQLVLSRYERLRKANGGVALSAVINGVCQVCHFSMPAHKLNQIRRGEELFQCDNCQRIVIYK